MLTGFGVERNICDMLGRPLAGGGVVAAGRSIPAKFCAGLCAAGGGVVAGAR